MNAELIAMAVLNLPGYFINRMRYPAARIAPGAGVPVRQTQCYGQTMTGADEEGGYMKKHGGEKLSDMACGKGMI
jgi:hypothetical protein